MAAGVNRRPENCRIWRSVFRRVTMCYCIGVHVQSDHRRIIPKVIRRGENLLNEKTGLYWVLKTVTTRRSHHSQECSDPRLYCFCDLWPLIFDTKINEFLGLIVEQLYVKFDDTSRIGYWDTVRKNSETSSGELKTLHNGANGPESETTCMFHPVRQVAALGTKPYPVTAVGVVNELLVT